jgi:hypothetical protein
MESDVIGRIAAQVRKEKTVVASEDSVRLAEASLGFAFPELLKSIYLNVANGGFGPGYGIIGVAGGHRSDLGNVVETFSEIKRGAAYLGLKWNPKLLPFCGWGCNIFSCVDCSSPRNLIYRSDECKARPVDYGLEDFFERWLDGEDLLGEGATRKAVDITNPFTGKKMRVKSK